MRRSPRTTWIIALTALALLALAGASASARVLVEWAGPPPAGDPGWVMLHGLDGAVLGALPDASGRLDDPRARTLGPYDEALPYVLISRSALAALRDGALPPAWQGALTQAGAPAPPASELRAIEALAADEAQALILLPESLRPVLDEPGGRTQRLRAPERAAARSGAVPEPGRRQPPEFWAAAAQAIDGDRLRADIDDLATTLRTRHSYTPQMVQACQYALDRFAALGLQAALDPFTYAGRALTNVVGIKPGTVDPSRIYVLCGHLDSTSPSPTTNAPGAEDNGSGAVAVLEAARLLAPLPTDYTIYFVCFSAEEQGLVGSEHFAAEADQQNLDIRGVINFDMIAYYDPAGADLWLEGFHYGASSTWLMDLVEQNAEAYTDLAVYRYPGEGWGSDHEPFHSHGFPAILAIENEWDSYPCYHRTCDTADRLDLGLWSRILAANLISLGQLAEVRGALGGIRSTVLLSGGGSAIGARARLQGTGYPERVVGLAGLIEWPAVLPGGYTLVTTLEGYVPDTTHVDVSDGGLTPVTIVLHPEGGSGIASDAARGVSLQVSPAPLAAGGVVRLTLDRPDIGSLAVFGLDGRSLVELQPRAPLAAGEHAYAWEGRDARGHPLPAGVYYLRWEGEGGARRRTLVTLR
jgi:hypothetical protein